MLRMANSVLRFGLELGALAALAVWGARTGDGVVASIAIAVAAPAAAAVLWGLFVAPRRRFEAPLGVRLGVEIVVFGGAVAALVAAGEPVLAVVYGALVVLSSSLHLLWRQDEATRATMDRDRSRVG